MVYLYFTFEWLYVCYCLGFYRYFVPWLNAFHCLTIMLRSHLNHPTTQTTTLFFSSFFTLLLPLSYVWFIFFIKLVEKFFSAQIWNLNYLKGSQIYCLACAFFNLDSKLFIFFINFRLAFFRFFQLPDYLYCIFK